MGENLPHKVEANESKTADELQALKAAAELNKLQREADKIALEIEHLRRPPIFHPSAYIPILAAFISLSGVLLNLWFTTQQRDKAVAAQEVAETAAQRQQSYATSLKRTLDQNQVPPPKTVNIRFRGALSRQDITALQQSLNASGFVAPPPLRTEEVPRSSVTYYYPDDRAIAEEVLNQATAFFNQRGCPINFQPLSPPAPATNNARGTILLDVYHSCQTN